MSAMTAQVLRRDPADVIPWAETCGQIRCLVEEKDGAAAEVHQVEIHEAKMHYHAKTDEFYYVIEGQGSIFHPGYLQVTIGLLVGSQPDAFVVCHDPLRKTVSGWPDFPLPSIAEVIERTVAIGRLTNPLIRCVGISLNTSKVPADARAGALAKYAADTGLPTVDPLVEGVGPIVSRLLREFPA